jgi:hypothetical protein
MKLVAYSLPLCLALPACLDSTDPVVPDGPPPLLAEDCYIRNSDCPYVVAPLLIGMNADDWRDGPDMPVAAGGTYRFTYTTYHERPDFFVTTAIDAGFRSKQDGPGAAVVHAAGPGTATFTVASNAPYHDTVVYASSDSTIDVLPIAKVRLDLPKYEALAPAPSVAPVFVGSSFIGAVRLVAEDGRKLADLSLDTTGAGVTSVRWDAFRAQGLATGRHSITVQGSSLAEPVQIPFEVIEHVDEIRSTVYQYPPPSYYQRVCAHAFSTGREVLTEWDLTVTGTSWIPEAFGNCVEMGVGPGRTATVTMTAADGSTLQRIVTRD